LTGRSEAGLGHGVVLLVELKRDSVARLGSNVWRAVDQTRATNYNLVVL
jgi:hypothetical protein